MLFSECSPQLLPMTTRPIGPFIQRCSLIVVVLACCQLEIFGQNSADPNAQFTSLSQAAEAARNAGNAPEAIRDYRQAVAIRPDWAEGWWYLGTILYEQSQFADAQADFQKVVQLVPGMGAAWNFLGLCEFETKDYASSLTHLEKGLDLGAGDDPDIARVAAYHLALLRIKTGNFDQATSLLASVFPDNQTPEQVKNALGLALLRVPLLPTEVDPSQDGLIHAAGDAASVVAKSNPAIAVQSLEALSKSYPNAPYLRYALGKTLASAGNNAEALQQLRTEMTIVPESALPWIEISGVELRLKHLDASRQAAEKAVHLAPQSSAAHRTLANVLRASGEAEKAAAQMSVSDHLATEPPHVEENIAKIYSTPTGNASAAATGDIASSEAWRQAMVFYTSSQYPEAIAALKKWVQAKPNDGTAWAVLALSEYEMKDYDNALIHLQRGRVLGFGGSPESVQLANYRLAILLNRSGDFERASTLAASTNGPLSKEVQFVRGMTLLRIPLFPEQVEASKRAIVQMAGETAELLLSSQYEKAFANFQEMLKQSPQMPFLHYAYGTALIAISEFDKAETQMRDELPISLNSELPWVRLASIAMRQKRAADVLSAAKEALILAPGSGEAHYLLGRGYLDLGQIADAVQELETASKISPNSPEIHFNLAKAYAKAKSPEKAEQERAIFARLNTLAEKQRSQSGNQAYEGPREAGDLPAVETGTPPH
jgi:tetratricopeptide (TPR) repeat protein